MLTYSFMGGLSWAAGCLLEGLIGYLLETFVARIRVALEVLGIGLEERSS